MDKHVFHKIINIEKKNLSRRNRLRVLWRWQEWRERQGATELWDWCSPSKKYKTSLQNWTFICIYLQTDVMKPNFICQVQISNENRQFLPEDPWSQWVKTSFLAETWCRRSLDTGTWKIKQKSDLKFTSRKNVLEI
jgi:hypothetical protein